MNISNDTKSTLTFLLRFLLGVIFAPLIFLCVVKYVGWLVDILGLGPNPLWEH